MGRVIETHQSETNISPEIVEMEVKRAKESGGVSEIGAKGRGPHAPKGGLRPEWGEMTRAEASLRAKDPTRGISPRPFCPRAFLAPLERNNG
jgi:hypothetical protein